MTIHPSQRTQRPLAAYVTPVTDAEHKTLAEIEKYETKAIEAFEAGFTSKAAQKRANEAVSRAFDRLKRILMDEQIFRSSHDLDGPEEAQVLEDLYFSFPLDLHHWRPKHAEAVLSLLDGAEPVVERIHALLELRQAIKAAPINKPEPKSTLESEVTAAIHQQISEKSEGMTEMQRAKLHVERGFSLLEKFDHLHVSYSWHMVRNQHGTEFPRVYFYMEGVRTPLQIILGMLQVAEDKRNGRA